MPMLGRLLEVDHRKGRDRVKAELAGHVVHPFPGFYMPDGKYTILLVSKSFMVVDLVAAFTQGVDRYRIHDNTLEYNIRAVKPEPHKSIAKYIINSNTT